MKDSKKETIALGSFFISLFFISFLIFNIVKEQIIIKISDSKEIIITQPFNLIHVLIIVVLTSICTASFYYYIGGLIQNKKYSNKQKTILNCLGSDEQKVYKLILSKKEIIQQEIVTDLNLSKVKVSRIIEKLSQKGLIKKYRQGY
ncbi:MAG: hypothetical protein OQK82_07925, partial [Candidatus Pacearchaeota archaeon]|nr:hypothetical protein [Candidatus Pacearchaeota archaeon]